MSYQVIARKWRPKSFDEVTGQEHITRTLCNAIEHDRLHHAYLFSGARGVGKTTTARLLAKALNCHKTNGPNTRPCDTSDPAACPSCIEIGESRSMDVLEFDAASNTQVDKIREIILESINVAPARDRYKIFIIDEVHMLSTSSFNALLKTVEEPPPNVVFIMATTERHKVPDTILSRCQQFEFRTISGQKIFERLNLIAEAESVSVTEAALREIARSGEGSMRDAQSNFDQVISFAGEMIDASDVSAALGIAGGEMLLRLLSAISDRDPRAVLVIVDDLVARAHDLRNFSRDLLAMFRDLLVFKVSAGATNLVDRVVLSDAEMADFSGRFSENDLLRFFNSVAETGAKLKDAAQPRYMLEIGLIKLIEMRRAAPLEDVLARLTALERSLSGSSGNQTPQTLAAAVAEKKTLISEPPFISPGATPVETNEIPAPELVTAEPPVPVRALRAELIPETANSVLDLSFLDSIPVVPPSIDSAELEQFDDDWLDTAFEDKLLRSGDNLRPLAAAFQKLSIIAKNTNGQHHSAASTSISVGNGAAAAIAADFANRVPEPEAIPTEIPHLPENATDEQLLIYAHSHPAVRMALRALRGKIIDVRRA